MTKIVLKNVAGTYDVTNINDNFNAIADALENKVLYRDNPQGNPNTVKNDLDMNGKRILNLPVPVSASEPARKADLLPIETVTQAVVDAEAAADRAEAVANELQAKKETISVRDFGAKGDGIADDTLPVQAAINAGTCFIPTGVYRITSPLILPSGAVITGAGQSKTTLRSEVIGDSLFKTVASSATYIRIADMSLSGNGVTGAGGNGHAINFIDPAIDSGTHTPQQCIVERVAISGFCGLDKRDNGDTKISSCAVIQVDGLNNVYRDVVVSNCGHGFYMLLVQNTKLVNCVVDGAAKYAVFTFDCENIIIDQCDLVNSGDGVADPGYPAVSLMSGIVLSYANQGFVLRASKLKNTGGKAAIVSYLSDGDLIQGNWIRGSALSDIPHKAIYAERSPGIRILCNTFSPSVTVYSATQKYEQIELYTNQTNEVFSATIENNTFGHIPIMTVAYNIKIGGNSSLRRMEGITIRGNQFGTRAAASGAHLVETDVLISSCTFANSTLSNNVHHAPANVTRSAGVTVTGATLAGNRIGPNSFAVNAGTIVANYVGVSESLLTSEVAYDAPSLVDGSGINTTVSVPGALRGDFAQASLSSGLSAGMLVDAWVSDPDIVTVRIQNETGATLDLGNQLLRIRVRSRNSW